MECQNTNCKSTRIINICAKHSDLCFTEYQGKEHDGYAPKVKNVCVGDYTDPTICLECGQVQGKFPVADPDYN